MLVSVRHHHSGACVRFKRKQECGVLPLLTVGLGEDVIDERMQRVHIVVEVLQQSINEQSVLLLLDVLCLLHALGSQKRWVGEPITTPLNPPARTSFKACCNRSTWTPIGSCDVNTVSSGPTPGALRDKDNGRTILVVSVCSGRQGTIPCHTSLIGRRRAGHASSETRCRKVRGLQRWLE